MRESLAMQDFNQLLHRLADSGLEFVIVGGYAAVTYGSSLVTRDLDICAVLSENTVSNSGRFWQSGIRNIG
jgi:predicted nucleotidyltransferase